MTSAHNRGEIKTSNINELKDFLSPADLHYKMLTKILGQNQTYIAGGNVDL